MTKNTVDTFINNLPENPLEAGLMICDTFMDFNAQFDEDEDQEKEFKEYIRYYTLLKAFKESYGDKFPETREIESLEGDSAGTDKQAIMEEIATAFDEFKEVLTTIEIGTLLDNSFDKYKEVLLVKFGKSFSYEFSQGDMDQVNSLLGELKKLITDSKNLKPPHKQRLNKKIMTQELSLQKKITDLDGYWGLMGDMLILKMRFGSAVNDIQEKFWTLFEVVWRTQARGEELPSDQAMPFKPPVKKKKNLPPPKNVVEIVEEA